MERGHASKHINYSAEDGTSLPASTGQSTTVALLALSYHREPIYEALAFNSSF